MFTRRRVCRSGAYPTDPPGFGPLSLPKILLGNASPLRLVYPRRYSLASLRRERQVRFNRTLDAPSREIDRERERNHAARVL